MLIKFNFKRMISNVWVRILTLFLLVIMMLDPITLFFNGIRYDNYFEGVGTHFYQYWILMNTSNWGGAIFATIFYIFPIIMTGLIYYNDSHSSIGMWTIVKENKIRYMLSQWFVVVVYTVVLFLVLFLINLLITSQLFDTNIMFLPSILTPHEGTFASELFVLNPLYVCFFYLVFNALILGLLAGVCVGMHMVINFPNMYIAMIVPVVSIFVMNYVFDSQSMLRFRSLNLMRQPAASYALNIPFSFGDCLGWIAGLVGINLALVIIGIIRNKDVM